MKGISRFLTIQHARKSERLQFSFLSFRFFTNSESGIPIYLRKPMRLTLLMALPYMAETIIAHLREAHYFVRCGKHVIGIFVLREKPDTLYISSLAVNPLYRRLGIGTQILFYSERIAEKMNKHWLELSVLKTNIPALRLYIKRGFGRKEERRQTYVLRKNVENS